MFLSSRSSRIALVTSALVVLGHFAGTGSAAANPTAQSVVGTWSAQVTAQGTTIASTIVFTPNGRFCLRTTDSTGSGVWRQAGTAFGYVGTEELPAGQGKVQLNQAGRQAGDSFTSTGIGIFVTPSGAPAGQAVSIVRATRTSTDSAC